MKSVIALTICSKERHLQLEPECFLVANKVIATQQNVEIFSVNINLNEIYRLNFSLPDKFGQPNTV